MYMKFDGSSISQVYVIMLCIVLLNNYLIRKSYFVAIHEIFCLFYKGLAPFLVLYHAILPCCF